MTNAEASTKKLFEEKKTNEEAYKKQIKPLKDEINVRKKELIDFKKVVKEKEKDLFRVNNKCENLELTVKRMKMENANLKNVKKKLDRGKKLEDRKKETASLTFTGGSISECKSLDVSPGNFLHTSPCNNNISESIKPLPCPPDLSSPRTPPGPPPTTAAGLSTTSSPAPEVQQPTAPPDAIVTGKYDDHDQESSDEKPKLKGKKHIAFNDEFVKLLKSIKIAKLSSSDEEQDDDYGSVDHESYPDYYWQMGYDTDDEKPKLEGKKHVAVNDEIVKLLESIRNAKLSSDEEQDDDYGSVDHESYPDYYWQMEYETDDGKHFELSEEKLVYNHSPLQTISQ